MAYEHLKLVAWPFTIVPRQQYCDFLAGRPQLRSDISDLIRGLSRRDTSSIHILWSWLGAGKTHSLYYLVNQARAINTSTPAQVELYPIYSEFPKRARGFLDLYQSAVLGIERRLITDSFLEATTSPEWTARFASLSDANPDLSTALRTMAIGNDIEQSIALRWLRADPLPVSEHRRLGISQRVSTVDQAIRILSVLIELCDMAIRSRGRQGFRYIWILDEFQRIERCGSAVAREVNAGLHSLFNASPVGLTMILSFSAAPEGNRLPESLSAELRSRIGATKVMILPPFQPAEALQFLAEVLGHFRAPSSTADVFFPFTKSACEYVIKYLAERTQLRPRIVMDAMNAVLEAGDALIEQGSLTHIDDKFAERVLKEYAILTNEESDEEDS
ncbi:MAG: hypothetical protein WD871_08390 [Xanthobacteraceae bacterium]